ncbi:hypothetical protein [Scytonema sp. HK-05]|uniref:hypothetical protein n=1 Tax=Scytonema sp. HK-05 TaxID=1137095 RepID=UPI0011612EE1|nr:hypothetical protein [Scytonema sp. HK-05]
MSRLYANASHCPEVPACWETPTGEPGALREGYPNGRASCLGRANRSDFGSEQFSWRVSLRKKLRYWSDRLQDFSPPYSRKMKSIFDDFWRKRY